MHRRDLDDPDMSLATLMQVWPATIAVFIRHRMGCVGCMASPFDTVTDACHQYGISEQGFRAELHLAVGH